LPSRFHVSELAAASIAAATLAAAELWSRRNGKPLAAVRIDRRLACAAFIGERLLKPVGWSLPGIWDPIAGDYPTADGWIRLHTNYRHHKSAALKALKTKDQREEVAAAVRGWKADELESAVVGEGGAAEALRTLDAWASHPQGAALIKEPLVAWDGALDKSFSKSPSPLGGLRVLDLTRVIAGPVGTRHL